MSFNREGGAGHPWEDAEGGSGRLVSHCDAMQLAVLREEVAHRVVLGGAVVPHRQRAWRPAQAGLELGHLGQGKQLGQ